MVGNNPTRPCIGCGQVDDHPRHVVATPDGNAAPWHMDCHARSANGCEVCAAQIAGAGGATGEALREHLLSLPPRVDGEAVIQGG
jgi:hypothetical protein